MARKKPPSAPPDTAPQSGAIPEAPPATIAKPALAQKPAKPARSRGKTTTTTPTKARAKAKAGSTAAKPLVPEAEVPKPLFPIVGIGASAGGLEAFTHFLQNLPVNTGMGFVLVQHMAPRAHSMLPEILAKTTAMPVTEVRDRMKVEPDHIYVTPPDIEMSLSDGVLRLLPRQEPRVQHRPVDAFLRSLAEDRGSRAIGVILSGTASDGTQGMKVIKGEGGITFAQDEDSAKYYGMPQSSIAAGVVDFVLPPDQIARELARIANHPYVRPEAVVKVPEPPPVAESEFNRILRLLRTRMGIDFTYYKHNTIKRRILRRMVLHQVEKIADYLLLLESRPEEVKKLYEDILINVTGFFRDPESFEALAAEVFPQIIQHSTPENSLRIWVPGCATGEEAYSIVIALLEFLGKRGVSTPIQVFATDIEESVISKARAGIYPEGIEADVSPERLRRFFTKAPGGYQISKAIREMCVFAMQNLIKDPPFSRMDLISCRNVLIYLGPVLQKKLIPAFHFALKPGGFLMLGKSETIGTYPELFNLVDKKYKIYTKKPVAGAALGLTLGLDEQLRATPREVVRERAQEEVWTGVDLLKEADRLILTRYSPPGVIIDENLNILQFRGHTGPFLEPSPGEASLNLMKMLREGLALEVRSTVYLAIRNHAPRRKEGLRVKFNGRYRQVNVEVIPLKPGPGKHYYYLIVFEETTPVVEAPPPEAPRGKKAGKMQESEKDRQINQLESDLAATKEYLQAVVEEQESTVEELKSANEELMSSNEELQSINEEMETSKEELQASNEELATLNEELENRNIELSQTNNDLTNLLSGIHIPVVMLGSDLRVRRFNPTAADLLDLMPADLGRPVGELEQRFKVPQLDSMVAEVIRTLKVKTLEVQDRYERWHSLEIRPYLTMENRTEGAVLTMLDISAVKKSLLQVQESRNFCGMIMETVREPMLVLDTNLRVLSANPSFYRTFQVRPEETLNLRLYELGNHQWDIPLLRKLLDDTLLQTSQLRDSKVEDFKVEHDFPSIGRRTMSLNARRIMQYEAERGNILLAIEDITERLEKERQARDLEEKLRQLPGSGT